MFTGIVTDVGTVRSAEQRGDLRLGLADRILVLAEGRVAGELPGQRATEEAVMRLATGSAGPR